MIVVLQTVEAGGNNKVIPNVIVIKGRPIVWEIILIEVSISLKIELKDKEYLKGPWY